MALMKGRDTPARSGDTSEFPVKGGVNIHPGALVALDASDLAVPMSTAATLVGVGRAEHAADNTGGADGDLMIRVGRRIYKYKNSADADLITRADIGDDCYGVDDETVAKTNGTNTRSKAGKIHDVDSDGVWVKFS